MGFTNIDVNEKVNLFNKTIKNIILNYIPNETITCGDRDLPWINKDIKKLIHEVNKHNQKLIIILENQKFYGGFLEILIFRVSLSRTHLQSETRK